MDSLSATMSPLITRRLAQLNTPHGSNIALDQSVDDDVVCLDFGLHARIRTNGEAAFRQRDGSFQHAIHV